MYNIIIEPNVLYMNDNNLLSYFNQPQYIYIIALLYDITYCRNHDKSCRKKSIKSALHLLNTRRGPFKAINYNRKEASSRIAKNVEIIAHSGSAARRCCYILFIPFTGVAGHKKVLVGVIKKDPFFCC